METSDKEQNVMHKTLAIEFVLNLIVYDVKVYGQQHVLCTSCIV